MTSDKQVQANRRNVRKSTGPKTPEGKDVVRQNALKHGLLSQEVLLPNEGEAALKELGQSLRVELKPVGEMENLLVERLIASTWRLRRLGRVEAGIFALYFSGTMTGRIQEASIYSHIPSPYGDRTDFGTTTMTDKQKHREIEERAREVKRVRDSEITSLVQTFIEDVGMANAFSKLSHYETMIERSLYRALHELQRLQAARHAGSNVPPPTALDVDSSVVSKDIL